MTKYYCIVCLNIYDDNIGMPIKCCDKILRHIIDKKIEKKIIQFKKNFEIKK